MVRDEYGFHIYILEVKYLGYAYANINIGRTFKSTKKLKHFSRCIIIERLADLCHSTEHLLAR